MRSKVVRMLALALLLGAAAVVPAQQATKKIHVDEEEQTTRPAKQSEKKKRVEEEEEASGAKQKAPAAKSKLEEMLAEALKNNPDIRVAAAKVAEAEAELNRTRLQVTQKVVTLYYAIEAQKKIVEHAEKRDNRRRGVGTALSPNELDELRQTLALAKGKLAELEAQLPALLGTLPQAEDSYYRAIQEARLWRRESIASSLQTRRAMIEEAEGERSHSVAGPMAEKIRKALRQPITVEFSDISGTVVANTLSNLSGLVVKYVADRKAPIEETVTLGCKDLPFSSVLQLLEDSLPNYTIVVRDYGLLITASHSVPPGAVSVQEFLRRNQTEESRRQSSGPKNPPAENVEGLVKNTDASGLMTLTIGSDAGLTKGHTLELFRLNPAAPSQSKYLGTIRLLEVEAHQSVAQPVGRLSSPPQRGDRVASRLLGK